MTTRVVLVDDVPEVRRLVRTSLRFAGGFEVVGEAGDGVEALQLVAELQPDIVVLDLGLPDIAGREVLTRIRASSPATRIVVFSGTADPPDRQWIDERVEGYVLKDAELDLLLDLLHTVRDRQGVAVCDLPKDLLSVRESRRFLREILASWAMSEAEDAAQLVVSELVTNAITHADSACRLRLSRTTGGLRVEVVDGGTGTPDPQPPSATGLHGRGMHIVDALAVAWGTELLDTGGKVVWAELPRSA
ncbi:response regulator [Cellulomonas sp. ATA003]|uniref:response regulator n=1 Tax=Cellulomonas sp. ATA003 TaxID=3073064 RepID=UPI002873B006|nr:response regulator [Cellulomonas sp. ATA003]WNB86931.1 response regulator [Cellulomonas sp. ATA003]